MQVYNKKVYPKKKRKEKEFNAKNIMTQKDIVSMNMR